MGDSNNLEESLKPFYQRASEAELYAEVFGEHCSKLMSDPSKCIAFGGSDAHSPYKGRAGETKERLARLEFSVASKTDPKNEELERTVAELQSKLKDVTAELEAEREKGHKQVEQLTSENEKLKYRIKHLVRSLEEVHSKLASK